MLHEQLRIYPIARNSYRFKKDYDPFPARRPTLATVAARYPHHLSRRAPRGTLMEIAAGFANLDAVVLGSRTLLPPPSVDRKALRRVVEAEGEVLAVCAQVE
ncbi:hypothetical protein PG999_003893 [Apiospora kogelbergensis]|uniref:Uncharacterized protein n=1 Tax=Apiospora kogelbergensis TaxID=1337665 RepID=A0AAW0R4R6_9PEZI